MAREYTSRRPIARNKLKLIFSSSCGGPRTYQFSLMMGMQNFVCQVSLYEEVTSEARQKGYVRAFTIEKGRDGW
jgi:hypothetical protein